MLFQNISATNDITYAASPVQKAEIASSESPLEITAHITLVRLFVEIRRTAWLCCVNLCMYNVGFSPIQFREICCNKVLYVHEGIGLGLCEIGIVFATNMHAFKMLLYSTTTVTCLPFPVDGPELRI